MNFNSHQGPGPWQLQYPEVFPGPWSPSLPGPVPWNPSLAGGHYGGQLPIVGGMRASAGQEFSIVNAQGVRVGYAVLESSDEVVNLDELKFVPKETKFIAKGYGSGNGNNSNTLQQQQQQVPNASPSMIRIKREINANSMEDHGVSTSTDDTPSVETNRDGNSNFEEGVNVSQGQGGQGSELKLEEYVDEMLHDLQTVAKDKDDSQNAGEVNKRNSMDRKAKRKRLLFDENFDEEDDCSTPTKSNLKSKKAVKCPNGCGQYYKNNLARHMNTEKCKRNRRASVMS